MLTKFGTMINPGAEVFYLTHMYDDRTVTKIPKFELFM